MLQHLQSSRRGTGLEAEAFVTTERNGEKTHTYKGGNVQVTTVTTAQCLKTKASLVLRKRCRCTPLPTPTKLYYMPEKLELPKSPTSPKAVGKTCIMAKQT